MQIWITPVQKHADLGLVIINYFWSLIINNGSYYYPCWKQFLLLNIFVETIIILVLESFINLIGIYTTGQKF